MVRDKYDDMYPHRYKQYKAFTFPENGFREMNLDVDFGDVMGHRLSMKLGKQQIVWGESDLFRSIDIANPLRLDQNQAVGEAFEDFRSPIWAIKFLYDIGNVGTFLSNVGLELFYTPRWRPITQHLVLEGGWGGLRYDDPNYIGDVEDYFPSQTSNGVTHHQWRPLGAAQGLLEDTPSRGPCFALDAIFPGMRQVTPGVVPRDRVRTILRAGIPTSCTGSVAESRTHHIRGTKWDNSMVGFRMMGKIFDNFDFTLNYMYKRTDPGAVFHLDTFFGDQDPLMRTANAWRLLTQDQSVQPEDLVGSLCP